MSHLRQTRSRAEYPEVPVRPAAISAAPQSWRQSIAPPRTPILPVSSQEAAIPRFLYTKEEVAKALGVSETHIDNLVKAGQLAPTYVGSRKKNFSMQAIQAFIAAGTQPREMKK